MLNCTLEELSTRGLDTTSNELVDKIASVGGLRDKLLARHQLKTSENQKRKNDSVSEQELRKGRRKNKAKTLFNRKDVTDAIEHEVRLRTKDLYRKANFDALTHLPNRRHFNELLDNFIKKFQDNEMPFTLLFMDLDGFKKVNDSLGHATGDELLRHVSARLLSSVRQGDIVARLAGDEFMVLLHETIDKETIEMVCKRIIKEVSRSYFFDRAEVKISTSIGIAKFPEDAKTASDLMHNADEALYLSKSAGKRTYRFYGEVQEHKPNNDLVNQARFDDAIANHMIQLQAIPQVSVDNRQLTGASLELIWQNSGLTSNHYDAWKGFLQKSGWDYSVATWVMDSALYYLKQWQASRAELNVAFPVLEALWRAEDFETHLLKKTQRLGLSPKQIHLIFDMQDLVSYDAFFTKVLQGLKRHGFQLTLKGLGETPIDFSLLAELDLDRFMMSNEWLQKAQQESAKKAWSDALILMARSLGIDVVLQGELNLEALKQYAMTGVTHSESDQWLKSTDLETFIEAIEILDAA